MMSPAHTYGAEEGGVRCVFCGLREGHVAGWSKYTHGPKGRLLDNPENPYQLPAGTGA